MTPTPTPPPAADALRRAQRLARVRLGLVLSVALLAAGIAGLGYVVSFEAISSFVVRIGALPKNLRWCGPLLVDTFITLATVFLVWLALSGERLSSCWDAYYAWSLIAVATVASAYLNAAHVQPVTKNSAVRWDARITAGAVPFAVLASVHLLVLLLLRLLAWAPAAAAAVSTAEAVAPADREPAVAPKHLAKSRQAAKGANHIGVRALLAEETKEKPVTWQDVRAATGLSRSRAYAMLRRGRESLAATNGNSDT